MEVGIEADTNDNDTAKTEIKQVKIMITMEMNLKYDAYAVRKMLIT